MTGKRLRNEDAPSVRPSVVLSVPLQMSYKEATGRQEKK
jgi:hypothetical protein